MGGSDQMPAPARMRADDAQYDKPLRATLLRRGGPLPEGAGTADEDIIRGGGQARRPGPGGRIAPGAETSLADSRAFPRSPAQARIPLYPIDWHRKAGRDADGAAGLADAGNLSLALRPWDGRRATKERNKR